MIRDQEKERRLNHHEEFYKNCQKIHLNDNFAQIKPTKLAQQITKFYIENKSKTNPILKIKDLNIEPDSPMIPLSQALTFKSFKVDNPIYTLKYLGNLYINLKRAEYVPLMD